MNKSFLDKTLDLAAVTNQSIPAICEGAKVSERWLYKVLCRDISDPGVRRVQRLHDYLLSVDGDIDPDAASDAPTLLPEQALRDVG